MINNPLKSSSADFSLYPLLWLSVCLALGILAANFFSLSWQIPLAVCLSCVIFSISFLEKQISLIFLFIAFASVGALLYVIDNKMVSPNRLKRLLEENRIVSGEPIEIEGVLRSNPELTVGGFFLELKSEKAFYKQTEMEISGNVRFFAPVADEQIAAEFEELNLAHGSKIRAACVLKREESFLNPGVISQTQMLDEAGIDATAILKSPLLVENSGREIYSLPLGWIYDSRQNLILEFHRKFNIKTAGVLNASLLGNKYFLDKQTAEIFREGGTFHVLVISGLHITFIGGLTLLLVRFFTEKRLWQFVFATAFLWSYSLAVGAEIPVVRAAIMFTFLLFSLVIYRRGGLLNSFGASVILLLVWRPNDLFSASFQLTTVSVLAIVAIAFPLIEKLRAIGSWSPSVKTPFPPRVSNFLKKFCEMLYWRESVWEIEAKRQIWTANIFKSPYLKWLEKHNLQNPLRFIFESLAVSLIVQVCLLPLTVLYFHRVPIFGVFLNIWVGIFIALESFAAIFAVIFAQISDSLAFPLIKLTEILNWLLLSIPNFLTENYWASFRVPHYSGAMKAVYFLYFLPILLFAAAVNIWNPFAFNSKFKVKSLRLNFAGSAAFLFFLALILFHPFSAPRADGKLRFDFLDVGQGDSIFITFPNGETMLVDGGGRINFNKTYVQNELQDEPELFEPDTQNIGETVVSAFLWEKGYSKIDYILTSHAHTDHIQGLSDVAKNFRIKAAIFGRTPFQEGEFAELFSILQKRGIESIKVSRGDILSFGEVRAEILYPENINEISDNNNSIVLRIIFGNRKILLTGDIEKEAESQLSQNPEFLQADVVKAAHHGSRTSSTADFINATNAEFVIIPVGRRSPFGHPHKEVLERWKIADAQILTTGERGTVTISTDGKDLLIETFLTR